MTPPAGAQVRTAAAELAVALHTPVPYWLTRPLGELPGWIETAQAVMKQRE